MIAGLSPTWYTYLEQGRHIHPSAEVLDSLARVLGLTGDERRYLHLLAHGQVSKPRPLADEGSAEEIIRQLVDLAESSAYPVYAINMYCDLIAWNRAATIYYADFGLLPASRCNMMRWLFEAPEAKERLPDWNEDVRNIVARWRSGTATVDHDERLNKLVAELKALSPAFDRWWEEYDVQERRSRTRRFQHPQLGDLTLRLIVLQAADFAPSVVVFHAPVQSVQPARDTPYRGF